MIWVVKPLLILLVTGEDVMVFVFMDTKQTLLTAQAAFNNFTEVSPQGLANV